MPTSWTLALLLFGVSCGGPAADAEPDGDESGGDAAGETGEPDAPGPGTDTGGGHDDSGGTGSGGGGDTGTPDDGPPECVPSERMDCFHMDIGPAAIPEWEEQSVLTAGRVLVFKFSHGPATDGEQYGRIAVVGATGADEQGYDLRMWFSEEPGGSPLEGQCADIAIADAVFRWNQNKDVSGYCRLPDEAGTVFFNYALCTSTPDDFQCASDSAEFAPENYRFHMAGTTISY